MSHDQRPGKLRVVQNGAAPAARRRGDDTAVEDKAQRSAAVSVAAGAAAAAAAGAERRALPLLPATLFLLACIAGGVAVAVLRPFGIG